MHSGESHSTWTGHVDTSGRLLIPSSTRHAMGWSPGTEVVIETDGHSLRVLSLNEFTKEVQGSFGAWQSGEPLLSDELIADRRAEAERERRS